MMTVTGDFHDFCAGILPRVSRSFALSIEALPPGLREAVRTAYLLCRIVDSVEDARNIDGNLRESLFDEFNALIAATALRDASRFEALSRRLDVEPAVQELCQQTSQVLRAFHDLPPAARDATCPHLLEMSRGMRAYTRTVDGVGGIRIRDLDDLERYCYFVAGTVGNLLTALFQQQVPRLAPRTRAALDARAVPFGIGLQMVNIVKDAAEDLGRGDCFLPVELLEREGMAVEQLLEPAFRARALRVVSAITRRAQRHLQSAAAYTVLWPVPEGIPVRLFCAVPLGLAFATLDEVAKDTDTLRPGRSPKATRATTMMIFARARACAGNDIELRNFLATLAQPSSSLPQFGFPELDGLPT